MTIIGPAQSTVSQYFTIIDNEIIKSARRALIIRAQSIRNVEFGDVIERHFTAAQIRNGVAMQSVKPWLEEALGDKIIHPALYSISVSNVATAEMLKKSFDGLPNKLARG